MPMTLLAHIAAGGLALVSGFVALYAAKGERLHRRSGMLFFYAMVGLSVSGASIAALHGGEGSVIGGVLAGYLVVTALATVRPPFPGSRWLDRGAMLVALGVGLASVTLGVDTLGTPTGTRDGIPAVIFFKFGAVALLAAASDVRVIWFGARQGAARLARHLWRMCFALYIASASFFLGQADELPEALRVPALLAIPAFLPLLVMAYWLWRVRRRRDRRGITVVSSHEPG